MSDRPIIFSGPMIRALIDGRKTQTRRVLKAQPPAGWQLVGIYAPGLTAVFDSDDPPGPPDWTLRLPYAPGDQFWVREAFYRTDDGYEEYAVYAAEPGDVQAHIAEINRLPATVPQSVRAEHLKLHSPRFMPLRFSRLTLIVTDVRVQRVGEITEDDARAEGCSAHGPGLCTEDPDDYAGCHSARTAFRTLWDSLNARRGYGWAANPWVCAISFRVHRCNIDAMDAA